MCLFLLLIDGLTVCVFHANVVIVKQYECFVLGLYGVDPGNKSDRVQFRMEHSALNNPGNKWNLGVKFRPKGDTDRHWRNVWEYYPDAKVDIKHNTIELSITSPKEDHEFAVFGTPEIEDKKRMQLGIFGETPTKGKNVLFHAALFDDTMMAFEVKIK